MTVLVGVGVLVALTLANLILLIVVARKLASNPIEGAVRDELRQSREDAASLAKELRDELAQAMKSSTDTLVKVIGELGNLQKGQLDGFGAQLANLTDSTHTRLDGIRTVVESQLGEMRKSNETNLTDIRTTLEASLRLSGEESRTAAQALREEVTTKLATFQESSGRSYESMRQTVDEKLQATQDQTAKASRELREEVTAGLKANSDSVVKAIGEMGNLQKTTLDGVALQLKGLTDTTQSRLDAMRAAVDGRLKELQESNATKLDEMRKTVDEQLQTTLEKRLTESFMVVSGHLEAVQRGLGEMKSLASGVGDLQRVLTNVKARGTWAEVQLGAIVEQVLTPEQYAKNVQTRDDSREHVEYAVRLPGSSSDAASCIWLPIDSKFPQESYIRLLDAAQAADAEELEQATAELARTIRVCAQSIRDKYLAPPQTTDCAILCLPTEGLYAEVLRQRDLANELQQTYRVVVAGPTTLAALLSSLRMGFKTLAIQQRTSEVWRVLASVKTEFGKFSGVLTKVRRQLDLATRTIDDTGARTRAMERRLRDVEELPPGIVAADILKLPEIIETVDEDEEDLPFDDAEPGSV